jgi:hypothetical protein
MTETAEGDFRDEPNCLFNVERGEKKEKKNGNKWMKIYI